MNYDGKIDHALTTHLNLSEFVCPCCNYALLTDRVLMLYDNIRQMIGKPMIVHSGYRCPKHNKEIGGERLSKHMRGEAFDFIFDGWEDIRKDPAKLDSFIKSLQGCGAKGVGIGESLIHADAASDRDHLAVWFYQGK